MRPGVSERAGEQMRAAERAGEASSAEQANEWVVRRFHSHLTHRAQLAPSPILSVCSRLYFFQFPPFTMSNVCLLLSVFSLSLVDPLYVILDYSTGSIYKFLDLHLAFLLEISGGNSGKKKQTNIYENNYASTDTLKCAVFTCPWSAMV